MVACFSLGGLSPCRMERKYISMNNAGSKTWEMVPVQEIDVLWIAAGLSCDGDTIAITGATQPSLEDIVRGAIPWIPKVNFCAKLNVCFQRS